MPDNPKIPEAAQREVAMVQQALVSLITDVGPPGVSPQKVTQAFQIAAQQEQKLGEIYEHLLDPDKRRQLSRWGLALVGPNGQEHVFHAPKRLENCKDAAEVMIWLASFGMLIAPVLRATAMLHGWKFQWKNVKAKDEAPSLIMVPGGRKDGK